MSAGMSIHMFFDTPMHTAVHANMHMNMCIFIRIFMHMSMHMFMQSLKGAIVRVVPIIRYSYF